MRPSIGADGIRVAIPLLSLFVVACGGNQRTAGEAPPTPVSEATRSAPAQTASQADPCRILTDDEINAQLDTMNNSSKTSARRFTPFPEIGGGQCEIEAANGEGFKTSFTISVSPASTGRAFIETGKRTPIPGIGDEAFEVQDNYYAFAKGLVVHIVNAPGRSQSESSAALLRAAVGRL